MYGAKRVRQIICITPNAFAEIMNTTVGFKISLIFLYITK